MFVCGPPSYSVWDQCISDNACAVSVLWAAWMTCKGDWDVILACQWCSSFVFCSGSQATEEETCQNAFLMRALPSLIFPCTPLPWWTFLFQGVAVPAAQSLALHNETDRICSTCKPVGCSGLFYFWVWNAALGNRKLHWKHLVTALFLAAWRDSCGQRNSKYIVGVRPVQNCFWSNS